MIDIEYSVIPVPFPGDIMAAVRLSPDGWANIYINDKLSPQAAKRALEHELRHLARDDFYNSRSIRAIECRQRRERTAPPDYVRSHRPKKG